MIIPLFEPALWVGLVTLPCTSALLISHHFGTWETPFRRQLALVGIWAIAGLGSWIITESLWAWGVAAIGIFASLALRSPLRNYFLATRILLTALIINVVAGVGLSIVFINGLAISSLTRTLLLVNLGVGLLSLPLILIALLPTQAYILRKRWRRPRRSLPPQPRDHYPKVSFHVPSHAEPPEVVCATLDALSRVRYPNFEVLVIDNNTADPALWYPLKDRCEALNDKLEAGAISSENQVHRPFRFFHVEGVTGAKAGALNFALEQTAADAELVSVIDADYQAQPNFLERLVGFFDDPNLGFVQTPHDYRGWQNNVYLRACYWECMVFFRLQLSCLSEWTASFIIGTMCIVRREAIEQAGGWATWCLTEDSESAVRIHALGYDSICLSETFGRGLIPDTFRDFKKQRMRWTMGPIQQLFEHWRLYLPNRWATPSKLSFWQRVLELSHSGGGFQFVINLMVFVLGAATLASIFYHQDFVPLPTVVWWGAALGWITVVLNTWLNYRLLGCTSLADMALSSIAFFSLKHIRFAGTLLSVFGGIFGRGARPWQRTNKFKVLPNRLRALGSVKTETCLALITLPLGSWLLLQGSVAPVDVLFALGVWILGWSATYLTSLTMALLADAELRH